MELEGPLPFEMIGILESILKPLADAGIGILAISTFDTDWVLVKDGETPRALEVLRRAGHLVGLLTNRESTPRAGK